MGMFFGAVPSGEERVLDYANDLSGRCANVLVLRGFSRGLQVVSLDGKPLDGMWQEGDGHCMDGLVPVLVFATRSFASRPVIVVFNPDATERLFEAGLRMRREDLL